MASEQIWGCPAGPARTNPKLEIRNKHQIQMTNSQNTTNQPARGGLVLRTCSFVHWNLFRISDFGFRILPAIPAKPAVSSREKCGHSWRARTLRLRSARDCPMTAPAHEPHEATGQKSIANAGGSNRFSGDAAAPDLERNSRRSHPW